MEKGTSAVAFADTDGRLLINEKRNRKVTKQLHSKFIGVLKLLKGLNYPANVHPYAAWSPHSGARGTEMNRIITKRTTAVSCVQVAEVENRF